MDRLLTGKMSSYLAHHGIIGQKWGEKHGPPYPLDRETSGKVQTKGRQDRYKKKIEKN